MNSDEALVWVAKWKARHPAMKIEIKDQALIALAKEVIAMREAMYGRIYEGRKP